MIRHRLVSPVLLIFTLGGLPLGCSSGEGPEGNGPSGAGAAGTGASGEAPVPGPLGSLGGGGGDSAMASGGSSSPGSGGMTDPGTPGACSAGTQETEWATGCPTQPQQCTLGTWVASTEGSNGHPLRNESEHFALYWFTPDQAPAAPLEGVAQAPSSETIEQALATLENLWDSYMGAPVLFPEPYCDSGQKHKVAVHLDDYYPLWGGGWGGNKMGLWIGTGALGDPWGLAHEFMHGVQTTTQAFPECGGEGCWIFESHANWMPHQVYRDNVHCSEMLVNAPHLYYGNTRDRYCNWQFFEFLKDKHCYSAAHDMWAHEAPAGQRDPWQKLMLSQGWGIEELNDLFGEWAMHNVTWDYKNPDGGDQGEVYRSNYGALTEDPGSRTARRLRLTRLEALGNDWESDRRFVSPYYWAPQRWGYNIVRLFPEAGAEEVTVNFRGVVQEGADTGFRWGLVATNPEMTQARYGALLSGADGQTTLCIGADELLFLVVVATPTKYQKITWDQPSDGRPYPSIYRYPYMVELSGAWPEGFTGGAMDPCPDGTAAHENGGGCAPEGTPASVFVGPYARVLGGSVSGDARIVDQATVVNGTVSGGVVGGLSLIGVEGHPGHGSANFNVSGDANIRTTFYPLGWFGNNQSASGSATILGDVEFVATEKSNNAFYGLVTNEWAGASSVEEVTTPPPYTWRP